MVLTGLEATNNYIDILYSGHMSRYRNIYCYISQYWEILNMMVNRFYLQRIQRGGHGKHAGENVANQF